MSLKAEPVGLAQCTAGLALVATPALEHAWLCVRGFTLTVTALPAPLCASTLRRCAKELVVVHGASIETADYGGFTPLLNASWRCGAR